MSDELFELPWSSLGAIIFSAFGIYISVIIMTRICGKRSLSKMASYDFAMTVAVGSIIATTALSSSVSMVEGVLGMVVIYLLQMIAAYVRRNKTVKNLMDNSPLLLMDGPKIIEDNLKKARVTEGDLRSKLREANITQLSQVIAVIFETTGDISVLSDANKQDFDVWLMKDVLRS